MACTAVEGALDACEEALFSLLGFQGVELASKSACIAARSPCRPLLKSTCSRTRPSTRDSAAVRAVAGTSLRAAERLRMAHRGSTRAAVGWGAERS